MTRDVGLALQPSPPAPTKLLGPSSGLALDCDTEARSLTEETRAAPATRLSLAREAWVLRRSHCF